MKQQQRIKQFTNLINKAFTYTGFMEWDLVADSEKGRVVINFENYGIVLHCPADLSWNQWLGDGTKFRYEFVKFVKFLKTETNVEQVAADRWRESAIENGFIVE